jgi:hypothetical protein
MKPLMLILLVFAFLGPPISTFCVFLPQLFQLVIIEKLTVAAALSRVDIELTYAPVVFLVGVLIFILVGIGAAVSYRARGRVRFLDLIIAVFAVSIVSVLIANVFVSYYSMRSVLFNWANILFVPFFCLPGAMACWIIVWLRLRPRATPAP